MIRTFLILTLVLPAAPLAAQQRPSPEQMKAMAEKMQPGSEHRELAALEGRWTQEIQSGFGDGPDWDDEFHMTTGGWSYFLEHLRWYLERHRGVPRDLIAVRDPLPISRARAFAQLLGPSGLSTDGSLVRARAGERYRTTTAAGDQLSGTVVAASPDTWQMGLTIAELGDAILFIEIEPHAMGARAGFWLSTYGLSAAELEDVRLRFGQLYQGALHQVPASH